MREVNLPLDWQNCSLGDLLTGIQTGKSVRCDERPPQLQEKGLIKISAVTWGEFNENESKTLLSTDHLQSSHKIDIGDLLISRANTLELVGACVMVKNLSKNLYLSDKVLRLEINELLKPLVLRYLNSKDARIQIESLATGNQLSMRNISQDAIRAIRLPLPPLAEQKVIADKLDTLLAQVDNTKARLERIPEILKSFRQSVLAAAVSGKLTEEWRGNSNSVQSSQQEGWLWPDIPDSWMVKFYPDVVESRLGKMLDKAKNTGEPTKYLGNINVRWFHFDLENTQEILISKSERDELLLRDGDVLICEGGEPGRCAIWRETSADPIIFQKALHRARVKENVIIPEWLVFNIKNDTDNLTLEQLFTGTTIKHLTGKALKKYPVRIPPLEEQTEIVRRVEELFAFADRIEQAAQAAQSRVNNLTQSILAKAFRGELTADWRAANPDLISGNNCAEALLAKIKAERAKVKTRTKD